MCNECLDGVPFTVDFDNKIYCVNDFHRIFAPVCNICNTSITPVEGTDVGNSVAGNDRIVPLLKRLEELETFLDPLYAEKEASSVGVKMSLVESQHNTVKENQELLERVESLKPSLEVGSLTKMETLEPRVADLTRIQVDQREAGERLTEESLELVQSYNEIIASLSQAFIHADQVVSRAEAEINSK